MKKIIFLFIFVFLFSCDLDKSIDTFSKNNSEDINIISEIGDQSLQKAIDLYSTKTFAS